MTTPRRMPRLLFRLYFRSIAPEQPSRAEALLAYHLPHDCVESGFEGAGDNLGFAPCGTRRARRSVSLFVSALTLVGVFCLRYAVVEGGRQSAADPHATFEMTG